MYAGVTSAKPLNATVNVNSGAEINVERFTPSAVRALNASKERTLSASISRAFPIRVKTKSITQIVKNNDAISMRYEDLQTDKVSNTVF